MTPKNGLHPRNRHRDRYDFPRLQTVCPELSQFVAKNKYGDESIDFAHPDAVRTLNRALLKEFYGVEVWDIPPAYLCPPIPGRADYVHNIADVLAASNGGVIPRGSEVRILDIGVGANCIYPLIGVHEYGWNFVGADLNPVSLKNAEWIAKSNPQFSSAIEFRLQTHASQIFEGIIRPGEKFSATICNPPFHASLEEAQAGSRRKWNHLGKPHQHEKQVVNFGGQGAELWCEGGELTFLRHMIEESVRFSKQCTWFSSLVSKEDSLPKLYAFLKTAKAAEWKTLDMAQGQKKSRVLVWRF